MNRLDENDKAIAAEFIHFTVTRAGAKIPLDADNLAEWAESENARPADIERILRMLSSGETRIFKSLTKHGNNGKDERYYEVAHDALGPAILSWRKKHSEELRLQIEVEEEKRKQEAADAALEREKAEREKEMRDQQMLLDNERNLRQLERSKERLLKIVGVLIGILIIALGSHFYRKKNRELDARVRELKEQERKDTEVKNDLERRRKFEEQISLYKSLLDILNELQSGKPRAVNIALNRLKEKAEQNQIPEEYKPIFLTALAKPGLDAPDPQFSETASVRDVAVAVRRSVPKAAPDDANAPIVIYLHIQDAAQRGSAQRLETALESQAGYIVPGIENVGRQPGVVNNQLRYFRPSDKTEAEKISALLGSYGITAKPAPISGYENSPLVRPRQYELWLTNAPLPDIPAPVAAK